MNIYILPIDSHLFAIKILRAASKMRWSHLIKHEDFCNFLILWTFKVLIYLITHLIYGKSLCRSSQHGTLCPHTQYEIILFELNRM